MPTQYISIIYIDPKYDPDTKSLVREWLVCRDQLSDSIEYISSELANAQEVIDDLNAELSE